MAGDLMTKSEFAQRLGCAKSYVSKLAKQGRLVLAEDGRIKVEETLALLHDTTGAPARALAAVAAARPAGLEPPLEPAYVDWRERKERAQAEMAEMEVAQRRGLLLELDKVRALISSAAVQMRTRLEALPDQLAPVLAATSDEQQVRAKLTVEIEAALADLAHEFGKVAA